MIPSGKIDYFNHFGMDADSASANVPDGFYNRLENVELSENKTLRKIPGYQKFGDTLSTLSTSIKHLDRYLTEDTQKLIVSVDNKIYYSNSTPAVGTTLFLCKTVASIAATTIQQAANEATIYFDATHNFEIGDFANITISAVSYTWEVVGTTAQTVDIYGIIDYSIVGAVTDVLYGGRTTATLPVADASIFSVGDVVAMDGYSRHFEVESVDTVSTIHNLIIDESVYVEDDSDGYNIGVSERWVQFTTASTITQDDTPFDVQATQTYATSSMMRKSMIITDGYNEPLKYDGVTIHRLGFHEVPDIIDSISETSTGVVTAGTHRYKYTYAMYDANSELVESGASSERSFVASGSKDVLVPVYVPAYGVNNNLLYNIDRCVVTLWKTPAEGLTFYRNTEVPMRSLGSYNISTINSIAITIMEVVLAGTPNISGLVAGDYLSVWGCKDADNNGTFAIDTINNTSKYLRVITTAAPTSDATGTITRGYCAVCIRDRVDDTSLELNDTLYTNDDQEPNNDAPPLAKYITVWDNRVWFANGKQYQSIYIDYAIDDSASIADGDKFYITNGTITETYQYTKDASTPASGIARVKLPNAGYSSIYDAVQATCQAINAKTDGLCWAYYEEVEGAGTFILRERQRNTGTLQFKLNLGTDSLLTKIKIGDLFLTAADNNTYKDFTQSQMVSRVWYTKINEPAAFVGTFADSSTGSVFYEDIYPDNGQEVTAIIPMSNFMVIFKEDSCYRVSSTGTDIYSVDPIDKEIGCIAPKSAVSIGNRIFFLSRYGVYETDGFFTKFVGKRMRREWDNIYSSLITEACGAHNVKRNQYWCCIPYIKEGTDPTANNYIISYDYINDAWDIRSNFNATFFTKIEDKVYFGSTDGKVFSIREVGDDTDYRFDDSAIEGTVITKWLDLGDKSARKMFQYLISHIYQSLAGSSIAVYYAYDFREDWTLLDTITYTNAPWGHFSWGHDSWGYTEIEPVRHPLLPQKAVYVRFKFVNATKDEGLEIQGYSVEAKMLNTKPIKQIEG